MDKGANMRRHLTKHVSADNLFSSSGTDQSTAPPRPGGFNPHYATGYAVDLLWYGALF